MTKMTQVTKMTKMTTVTQNTVTMTVKMTVLQHNVSFLAKYGWSEADFWTRAIVSRFSMPVTENESLAIKSLLMLL